MCSIESIHWNLVCQHQLLCSYGHYMGTLGHPMGLGTPLVNTGRWVLEFFDTVFFVFGIGHRVCPLPPVPTINVCL